MAGEPTRSLHCAIDSFRERGEQRFDPVRFRFIESMAAQAQINRESPAHSLVNRARQALEEYAKDLASAREEAAVTLALASEAYPDMAHTLNQQFERCEYRALKRLVARAERRGTVGLLTDLSAKLTPQQSTVRSGPAKSALQDLIQQQEHDAIAQLGGSATTAVNSSGAELKSTRSFRDSKARARADQVLKRAVQECPEDAGPLNPQRLTIQSLVTLGELSPHYLNRFVEYIDTLMLLETLGKKTDTTASKKGRGKSPRKKP